MIQHVTAYHIQIPLKFTFKTAKGMVKVRDSIIVKIADEKGYTGYGECVAFRDPFYTSETIETSWQLLIESYLPSLIGQEVNWSICQQWLSTPMTAAAIENALLHMHCEQLGVNTVSYVMGQDLKSHIPLGVVIGDIPQEELLDTVARHVASGCHRIKLKVSPRDGYERASLVRRYYPNLTLAADANQSYTYDQIHLVEAYNDLALACIEEPFAMDSLAEYAKWKQERENSDEWHIQTPICLDESILSYQDLAFAISHRLIDVLNVKVGRLGGLIQAKSAINLCRECQIPYWIGSMVESGVSKMMHAQLAALGDSYMAGDLSDSSRYFEQDIIEPDLLFSRGLMTVPRGAGLGVQINDERLEAYTIKKVEIS